MNNDINKYITVTEIAELIGMSRVHVYREIKRGRLMADEIGKSPNKKRYLITLTALQDFLTGYGYL